MSTLDNLLSGFRKWRAQDFLNSWKSSISYGDGKGIEIMKNYELADLHIDLFWTIKENLSKGEEKHLHHVDVYHRCSYKDYKKVIKKVEAEEWPKAIALFEIELAKAKSKK